MIYGKINETKIIIDTTCKSNVSVAGAILYYKDVKIISGTIEDPLPTWLPISFLMDKNHNITILQFTVRVVLILPYVYK